MSCHALPSPFLFAPAHIHSHAPMAKARLNQYTYDSLTRIAKPHSFAHQRGTLLVFEIEGAGCRGGAATLLTAQ